MDVATATVIAIAIYLAAILAYRVSGASGSATAFSFFLADGNLGKWRTLGSVFATYFSAFTVVALPGMFSRHGIGAMLFLGLGVMLTPFVALTLGLALNRVSKVSSDFHSPIHLMLDPYRSVWLLRLVFASTVVFLIPYFSLQIAGVGKLISGVSGGAVPYWMGTLLILVGMWIYIFRGGMKADSATDLIQGLLMFALLPLLAVVVLVSQFDGSATNLIARAQNEIGTSFVSVPGPYDYFSPTTLLSFFLMFGFITITSPQMSARYMAAKDSRSIAWSMVFFPLVAAVTIFSTAILGLGGTMMFDNVSGDDVVPAIINSIANPILTIAFVLAILAAATSTIDSTLLVLGSMFGQKGDESGLRLGRMVMGVLLVAGYLISIKPPTLIAELSILQVAGLSVLLPVLAGPLIGLTSRTGAFAALVAGYLSLVLAEVGIVGTFGLHPGVIGMFVSISVYLLGLAYDRSGR